MDCWRWVAIYGDSGLLLTGSMSWVQTQNLREALLTQLTHDKRVVASKANQVNLYFISCAKNIVAIQETTIPFVKYKVSLSSNMTGKLTIVAIKESDSVQVNGMDGTRKLAVFD